MPNVENIWPKVVICLCIPTRIYKYIKYFFPPIGNRIHNCCATVSRTLVPLRHDATVVSINFPEKSQNNDR